MRITHAKIRGWRSVSLVAGGGEYPNQDGFGWTNGVLRKLLAVYPPAAPEAQQGRPARGVGVIARFHLPGQAEEIDVSGEYHP